MDFYNIILNKKSNFKEVKPKKEKLKNTVYKHKKDKLKYKILDPNYSGSDNTNKNNNNLQ
jgi:hypothetical protein